MTKRRKIIFIASRRTRQSVDSTLPRLIRDFSDTLAEFEIHSTDGTARIISGTGLLPRRSVKSHRRGRDGGVAELAAIVARDECAAAFLLLDPGDPWADAVENRALKRVCIARSVRLITTQAAADRWARLEAPNLLAQGVSRSVSDRSPFPSNWKRGMKNVRRIGDKNEPEELAVNRRSLALISHDGKKVQMVEFVGKHHSLIAKHQRVLTTGTTGRLLRLLFAPTSDLWSELRVIESLGLEPRLRTICASICQELKISFGSPELVPDLHGLGLIIREKMRLTADGDFVRRVMPLPSGPAGGDVLIADEVLRNECHSLVFFHDPMAAHPHDEDIRLLEHTSQLSDVYAECVSDPISAELWISGLKKELRTGARAKAASGLAGRLRTKYKLRDAVVLRRPSDRDADALGAELARACAGYVNHLMWSLSRETREIRIGVSWGWTCRRILDELIEGERKGEFRKPPRFGENVVWLPLLGIITAEVADREATILAQEFCQFFGGRDEGLSCAGFAAPGVEVPRSAAETIRRLESADIVITSASPWTADASLYRNTGLRRDLLPEFSEAAGTLSGVFLRENGAEVRGRYHAVGLGFEGFRRIAKSGTVILVCGGRARRSVLEAALKARLASVVITTSKTAEALLAAK